MDEAAIESGGSHVTRDHMRIVGSVFCYRPTPIFALRPLMATRWNRTAAAFCSNQTHASFVRVCPCEQYSSLPLANVAGLVRVHPKGCVKILGLTGSRYDLRAYRALLTA